MYNRKTLQRFRRFLYQYSSSYFSNTSFINTQSSSSSSSSSSSKGIHCIFTSLLNPRHLLVNNYYPTNFNNYKYYFSSTMSDIVNQSSAATTNNNSNDNDTSTSENQNNVLNQPNTTDNHNEKKHNDKKRKRNKSNNRWSWTKKLKQKKREKKNENCDVNSNNNHSDDNDNTQEDDEHNDDDGQEDEQVFEKKKNNRNEHNITRSEKEVNEGSFASRTMQELYNVHVLIDIPSISKADDTSSSNNNLGTVKSDVEGDVSTCNIQEEDTKLPKRKVAFFIGFLGTNYQGMQMNRGQRTIQAEIELALFKAKLISPSNFGYPNKYSWSSSARTDKGVSYHSSTYRPLQ